MRMLTRLAAVAMLLTGLCWSYQALALECGEGEPGAVTWVVGGEETPLYRAVFTGRGGTLSCFQLLNPQYKRRQARDLPSWAPSWLSQEGPMDMVTTWDTEYLPYSLSFRELGTGSEIRRVVQHPTATAEKEGWKAGDVKTGAAQDIYNADPTYTLVEGNDEKAVYVWPDPKADASDFYIQKTYVRSGTAYGIRLQVELFNFGAQALQNQPEMSLFAWDHGEQASGGLFSPPPNLLESMCQAGEDFERETMSDLLEEPSSPAGEARWTALGNRYFLSAVISRGLTDTRCYMTALGNGVLQTTLYRVNPFEVAPASAQRCYPSWYHEEDDKLLRCAQIAARLELQEDDLFYASRADAAYQKAADSLSEEEREQIKTILKDLALGRGATLYNFEIYIGPKDLSQLTEPGVGLEDSIDFWIVGFLSKPMLHLLRWFYSLIPHWAVAIIMLTILVKLALLYWTQKSFTQMQRMAQLKPMMEQLKEKYGKDKERLNQEMMALYKREKVNPLGGCLPMLLQMPVWIALYRTIYASVDLYQAPLCLWIQDLSAPDPYYVLPILLGASMFGQQKLTPMTMDNAQAKMMMYMMPIMFTVFMLFLPSGLNLYIFVNTLLSMAQQYYLRTKFSQPTPNVSGKK